VMLLFGKFALWYFPGAFGQGLVFALFASLGVGIVSGIALGRFRNR